MSSTRRRLAKFVALAILAAIASVTLILLWPHGDAPRVAQPTVTQELIDRGRYIATAADCVACHSVEGREPFSGGRPFSLPFGTIYSSNLTPDTETGIGGWTDGEFLRAVQDGIGDDDEDLYPAFPYASYHHMPEDDVLAVRAYLSTITPVRAAAPPNTLTFPFNQRRFVRLWKLLFMRSDAAFLDADRDDTWNRGAYLVNVLGHCQECHTPRNALYGLKRNQDLAGEVLQGWTAWNITSDREHGIGDWSIEELVDYLRYGYAPGRAMASGPMKEAIDHSLSKLATEDLRAMAVYLKTVPARANGPNVKPGELASDEVKIVSAARDSSSLGRRIFEGACASCHAWNGDGMQTPMAALHGTRSVRDPAGFNVVQTILEGGTVTSPAGHAFMPNFAEAYSDAEIASVANYVIAHFGRERGLVTVRDVQKLKSSHARDGE